MAEPSDSLDAGRRGLDDLGAEVTDVGRWERTPDGKGWVLRLTLRPADLEPAGGIPAATGWYVTVDDRYPAGTITFWPAKVDGITETFAHQAPNEPGREDEPWRAGWICLVDSVRGHRLTVAEIEPRTDYHRLVWHAWRALEWLRRASRNQLLKDGEPFEMPVFGQYRTTSVSIAYVEGPETFAQWSKTSRTEGVADLAEAVRQGDRKILLVTAWRDLARQFIFAPTLGTKLASVPATGSAAWLRFDRLLKRDPWRAPQTWREIREFALESDPDFDARLRRATSPIRDGKHHYVLMGFPVPRIMGEDPSRILWVAFGTRLQSERVQKTPINGIRTQKAAWMMDRREGALADEAPIGWRQTQNWHPEELATRGRFDALVGRRVLLVGAGALGSILAETLVRAGVTNICVIDPESLEPGNLVRHRLTMSDLEVNKASALAARLNDLAPFVRAIGVASEFPPEADKVEERELIDSADVVIDASASTEAAKSLAEYPWVRERLFVSLSVSFAAEKLYLFTGHRPTFPLEQFDEFIAPWLKADERPIEDYPHEGTGCFSPVFPAREDDIEALAAIAARQIDQRLKDGLAEPTLTVYSRRPNGEVLLLPEPPKTAAE